MDPQNNIINNSGDKQNPQCEESVKNDSSQNEQNININNTNDNKDSIKAIDNNNIDKINNNSNNINANNVNNANEININPVNKNNENDLNKNNLSNRHLINNVNNSIGLPIQNINSPPIQNLNLNNLNHQANPVIIYPQQNNQELSCKEKYPNCFWKTKLLFFYNCFDKSEENIRRLENTSICDCFFLLSIFYYL